MAKSSTPDTHHPPERVALITGASRGLGYTVAEFLARQRWTLILTARHEGPLLEAVEHLQATGASITAVPGDVARSEEHTSELQSRSDLVCRLLLEKKKKQQQWRAPNEAPRPLTLADASLADPSVR